MTNRNAKENIMTENTTTCILWASDHREGALGDITREEYKTLEEAHAAARELNCGIYSTDFPGIASLIWERGDGDPYLIHIEQEV